MAPCGIRKHPAEQQLHPAGAATRVRAQRRATGARGHFTPGDSCQPQQLGARDAAALRSDPSGTLGAQMTL